MKRATARAVTCGLCISSQTEALKGIEPKFSSRTLSITIEFHDSAHC
jgi:hypothetical protein